MTSSIKPEVHKIITMPSEEDGATAIGNMHKNMVKIGRVVPNIGSRTDKHKDRQTDRQTDTLITILCSSIGGAG